MKTIKIELKWALIFIVMGLLWMALERVAGLHDRHIDKHPVFTNLIAIPAIIIYVLALLDKRKNFYNGVMTYKQGFMTGLIITAFVTILTPLSQYITSTVITPHYFNNVIDYTVTHGMMTREAALERFNLNSYMVQSILFAPVMGIVTTAIVAVFTKRKG